MEVQGLFLFFFSDRYGKGKHALMLAIQKKKKKEEKDCEQKNVFERQRCVYTVCVFQRVPSSVCLYIHTHYFLPQLIKLTYTEQDY